RTGKLGGAAASCSSCCDWHSGWGSCSCCCRPAGRDRRVDQAAARPTQSLQPPPRSLTSDNFAHPHPPPPPPGPPPPGPVAIAHKPARKCSMSSSPSGLLHRLVRWVPL